MLEKTKIARISGPANVRTISALYEEVLESLKECGAVELDIESASDVDLTLPQLVYSARRFADTENKTFSISAPASGELRELLQRGGFLTSAADQAFWLHGREP